MKKSIIVFSLLSFGINSFAQTQEKPVDVKYRRSSLHTMVIESEKFPQKEVVLNAFNNAPFPDKYNEHTIGEKSFNPVNYTLTAEEKATIYKPSKMGKLVASAAEIKIDSVAKELPYRIQNYLSKEKIANKLVAKWFNMKEDGTVDDILIGDRGAFNASFLDTKTAMASNDGKEILRTVGKELIPNTFVVINKFNFYANEPVAAVIRDIAKAELATQMAGKPQMLIDKGNKGIDAVYEKTKEGYSIFATSYLYKLVWNDTIDTKFNTWVGDNSASGSKKAIFDKSDDYKLEFVGDEKALGLITFSLKEKRTEEQIITLSTIRIIDNVYAKLQKKYDVFKTKTPLYTGYPITAKIGLKEGLEGGDKFDVLEQNIDPKTGVATYKSIGTIKVSKDLIWDNMYNEGEEPVAEIVADGQEEKPIIDRTTFEGGKKFYSGLLIKQIK